MSPFRNEKPESFNIKPKVLWGFTLLLLLALVAIAVTYWGFRELAKTRQSLTGSSQKLFLLNSTLTHIYLAEGNIRAYTLTQDPKLLKQYIGTLAKVNEKIDSLRVLTASDSVQSAQIVLIKQLLQKKKNVLSELVALKKADWSTEFYTLALKEIERMEKDSVLRDAVIIKTTTTRTSWRDSLIKRPPAAPSGFFGRLKGWFSGGLVMDTTITLLHVEERINIDTLKHSWVPTDSLLRDVLGILHQIRGRQEETLMKLSVKELELLTTDLKLIDQIRGIVSLLETEELNDTHLRAKNASIVVGQSTVLIITLGSGALLLTLIFSIVILKTISRSEFYRQELIDAKRYADKLLHAKEEFLANISHEIRSPLTSIIGFSRLLSKTKLTRAQRENFASLEFSSEHLLEIINDLLDLSKIEGGFLRLEAVPFYPAQVAEETVQLFRSRANGKNLTLSLRIEGASQLAVLGDPFRLKQMMINLIANSIKFTEVGGIEVSVKLTEASGTLTFLMEVSDSGIGIEANRIDDIFERFSQADMGTTRRYGGTGLGLAIVKNLIRMHNGAISVLSEPGQGSSFTTTIPYIITNGVPKLTAARPVQAPKLPRGLRILAVDDDPLLRTLLQQMLRSLGCNPAMAASPADATEAFRNGPFDVVLSDIRMPAMSGFELMALLRRLENGNQPAVAIAITADSIGSNQAAYTLAGFQGVLLKPFDEFSLYNSIAGALGLKTAPPPHQNTESEKESAQFDLSDIERFCEGDAQAFSQVVQSIVNNAQANFEQLCQYADSMNWNGMNEVIHKMKSAFGQIKAHDLRELVDQIGDLGPDEKNAEALRTKIVTLQKAFHPLKELLLATINHVAKG